MSIQPSRSIQGSTLTATIQALIVAAMSTCAAIALIQFGQALVPIWRVDYIPFVSFGVGLVVGATTRLLHRPNLPLPWFVLRGVELILLFLVARSTLGLLRGPDFAVNYDPFYGGIDTELLALVVLLGAVWLLGWQLTRCLLDISGEVPLTDRVLMQDLDNTRQAARQTLIVTILISGGVMVLLNAVIRTARRDSGWPADVPVMHLLIYFGLGLILLSHTRLTELRAGWLWERIKQPANLSSRWLTATLMILIGLAAAALLLPTQYSLGPLATLNFLLSLIAAVVELIVYVITYLIAAFLSLFFPKIEAPARPPMQLPPIVAPTPAAVEPPIISEFVQSLIFWTIFLIVLGYLIVQYARRNPVLMDALQRLPGWRWLIDLWRRLRRLLGGLSTQLSNAIQDRLTSRSAPTARSATRRRWLNLRRLSPRDQVQFYYRAMLRRGQERGLARRPAQTPIEYARDLRQRVPDVEADVSELTSDFVEARYSQHSIEPERVNTVRRYWARIKAALKRK